MESIMQKFFSKDKNGQRSYSGIFGKPAILKKAEECSNGTMTGSKRLDNIVKNQANRITNERYNAFN